MTLAAEIAATIEHGEWQLHAACVDSDPETFFPSKGDVGGSTRAAKQICAGCSVRADCLDAGVGETYGIWGGLTERERRHVRRVRKTPQAR